MSAATSVDGRPTVRGRSRQLTVVVVAAAAIVAVTLTAHGLLVPAGGSTPVVRIVGAAVAVAAGGFLLRIDGPAQATTTLAVVALAAALTAVATFPASAVTWTPDPPSTTVPDDPANGGTDGAGTDVILDTPGGAGAGLPTEVVAVPEDAEVLLEDGQVTLSLPDGGRVVLGDAADLRGTHLQRPDGRRVAIGDGALLEVPAPLVPDEQAETVTNPFDAVLALLLGCFALLAFAPPVVRFAERTDVGLVEHLPEPPTAGAPPTRSVEDGLSDVLRAMLADPDPRTAVIGAYARLLAALADAGAPRRPEEGPHEHLWRSLGPLGVRRGPVHRLAELFVQARFTPRPVTTEHRDAAIGALADALADLRLDASDVEAADVVGQPSGQRQ